MEIDVTKIIELHLDPESEISAFDCSGSAMEHGENAASETWKNSGLVAHDYPLLNTEEKREAMRDNLREMGAWSAEEIAAFTPEELNTFLVQETMAAVRHLEGHDIDLEEFTAGEYQTATENEGGSLYGEALGSWYFYLGV